MTYNYLQYPYMFLFRQTRIIKGSDYYIPKYSFVITRRSWLVRRHSVHVPEQWGHVSVCFCFYTFLLLHNPSPLVTLPKRNRTKSTKCLINSIYLPLKLSSLNFFFSIPFFSTPLSSLLFSTFFPQWGGLKGWIGIKGDGEEEIGVEWSMGGKEEEIIKDEEAGDTGEGKAR